MHAVIVGVVVAVAVSIYSLSHTLSVDDVVVFISHFFFVKSLIWLLLTPHTLSDIHQIKEC